MMIQCKAKHNFSFDVEEDMSDVEGTENLISDRSAVAIASWWSSGGHYGGTLADLASGQPVIKTSLLDDIDATIQQTRTTYVNYRGDSDLDELEALRKWVLERKAV